jgi:hypothetical protein
LGLSWLPFDESGGATAAARRMTRARASEHPSLHPASCPRRRSDRSSRPARRSRTAKTIPGGSAGRENLLVALLTGENSINVEFSGPDFVSLSAGRFAPKTSLTTPIAFLLVRLLSHADALRSLIDRQSLRGDHANPRRRFGGPNVAPPRGEIGTTRGFARERRVAFASARGDVRGGNGRSRRGSSDTELRAGGHQRQDQLER